MEGAGLPAPSVTSMADKRPVITMPKPLKGSKHLQKWTKPGGLERFETKQKRELDMQRAVDDLARKKKHEQFDAQAKDNTMKHERAKFSITGGDLEDRDVYRENYEQTFPGYVPPYKRNSEAECSTSSEDSDNQEPQ